jgi:hypothetical protein
VTGLSVGLSVSRHLTHSVSSEQIIESGGHAQPSARELDDCVNSLLDEPVVRSIRTCRAFERGYEAAVFELGDTGALDACKQQHTTHKRGRRTKSGPLAGLAG